MTKRQIEIRDKTIELFGVISRTSENVADRALYHLLEEFKEDLPVMDGYFHKAFRQTDVLSSGHLDAAVWNLLYGSELFWECLLDAHKKISKPNRAKGKDKVAIKK